MSPFFFNKIINLKLLLHYIFHYFNMYINKLVCKTLVCREACIYEAQLIDYITSRYLYKLLKFILLFKEVLNINENLIVFKL